MEANVEVVRGIRGLSSDDDETRKLAIGSLLEHSKTKPGMQALIDAGALEIFEDLMESGQRGLVANCMSRICRFVATGQVDEWDLEGLRTYSHKFQALKEGNCKAALLKAIQYFAIAHSDKASLVVKAGWVDVTIKCKKELYGPAILLLDALGGLASLAGAIVKATGTEDIFKHVISKGEEREQSAGLHLACCVVSSLKQGGKKNSLSSDATAAWLTKLHTKGIIPTIVGCVSQSATRTSVERAVRLLAELSNHEIFLADLGTESVLRVLLHHELAMACFEVSLGALLHTLLANNGLANRAADAFTSSGGCKACLRLLGTAAVSDAVARHVTSVLSLWLKHAKGPAAANAFTNHGGLHTCLSLLDKASLVIDEHNLVLDKESMQAVKGVLSLLQAWSDRSTNAGRAFGQRPGLSSLLTLLTGRDRAIADPVCVLVSWALHFEPRDRPSLATRLGDDAIKALLHFLARCPKDAKYAMGAYERLIKAVVFDETSASSFSADNVLDRFLGVLKGKQSFNDMLVPGASCVEVLATYKRGVAVQLLTKGFPGLLVNRLVAENGTENDSQKDRQIMAAVNAILLWAADSETAQCLDIGAVLTLLKVNVPPHPRHGHPKRLSCSVSLLRSCACRQLASFQSYVAYMRFSPE
jgi:hypothetical protein